MRGSHPRPSDQGLRAAHRRGPGSEPGGPGRWLMRWPVLSIRASVVLAIIAGVVLPALLTLSLDARLWRASHEPLVERNRSALQVLAASLMTEPAWTLSEPGLRAAARQLLAEPSVCAVEVRELQPGGDAIRVNDAKCAATRPVVVRDVPVLHEGQQIALLRLGFDDTEGDRLLAERQRVTWWLVAAQVLFGVVVLLGVLSVRLLRPIDRLKSQAGALVLRGKPATQAWTRDDELGELGRHLNDVQQRLDTLFSELEAKNAALHRLAMHDQLTGLPNRTLFGEMFQQHAAAARRHGGRLALLFIDLDRFKDVNDSLGHAAGDELLLAVSRRLQSVLRESDVLCRMGGDEFLVMLPRVDDWDAVSHTAERLQQVIAQPVPLASQAAGVQVSASIGIAMYPDDGDDFATLAQRADLAMYRSKEAGRARHSFYHPDLDATLQARLQVERDLVQAVARDELRLHYQPVVDVRDGRRVAWEALLRWHHPVHGLLEPERFVAAAEHGGLILELGRWTAEAACAQLAAWKAAGLTPGRVAINLSSLQLRDPALPAQIGACLQAHGLTGDDLEVEVVESSVLGSTEAPWQTLQALREQGIGLTIDDFGTGCSSLSCVKRLRPRKLKIDRGFVAGLPRDADDRALAEAIIGMAQALGVEVVAVGVETVEQSRALTLLGCVLQQGWLHGRPGAPQDVTAQLAAGRADA